MNKRIRKVRTDNSLKQEDFAKMLGLSKNFISLIETGGRDPSDRTISDICRIFNVNEVWLRTGEGDPYAPLSRSQVIADFCADLLRDEEESFRRRFIEAISDLSMDEWKVLEKISDSMQKKS